MGLLVVPCRKCEQSFLWFTGNPVQLCDRCNPPDWKPQPDPKPYVPYNPNLDSLLRHAQDAQKCWSYPPTKDQLARAALLPKAPYMTPFIQQSYFKTVMLGVDDLGAAIILNRNDMSISAACGLVLMKQDAPLKLNKFQHGFCVIVGAGLEHFWPGHCEGAIQNDILRGKSAQAMLEPAAALIKAPTNG